MFDISKLSTQEYHAGKEGKPKPYKLKLFMIILKIVGFSIVDCTKSLLNWILRGSLKRENISNQLALVTGGGNGLGRAICFRLAREKCDLAIVDIDYNNALKTANEIMSQYKVTCRAYQCDISNIDAIKKIKADIESEMRGIDILVNNAGLLYVANFFDSEDSDIKKVIEVNLTAHIVMTRTFLTGMIERKRGKILTICSMGCIVTVPGLNVYCATKWGLNGFMHALADELVVNDMERFIQLTSVYPDIINTRKEVMDLIDKMNHFLPKLKPERVADEAVNGMLRRKEQVYISHILPFLFSLKFLPKKVKKFIINNFYDLSYLYNKK